MSVEMVLTFYNLLLFIEALPQTCDQCSIAIVGNVWTFQAILVIVFLAPITTRNDVKWLSAVTGHFVGCSRDLVRSCRVVAQETIDHLTLFYSWQRCVQMNCRK